MRKAVMAAVVMIPVVFWVCGHTLAEEPALPWSDDEINALFPAPLAGWSAGDVDVTKDFADFDSFMNAITGSSSARTTYELGRKYKKGNVSLEMTIRTLDPDMAGLITMAHDDPKAGASLAEQGLTPTTVNGLRAVSSSDKSENGILIKVGSNGVCMIECAGANCGDAVKRYLEHVDLQRIVDFVNAAE